MTTEAHLPRSPMEPASSWARFGADAFDYFLVGLLVSLPVIMLLQDAAAAGPDATAIAIAQGLLGIYEVVCIGVWGRTIGRRVTHTQVVGVTTGEAPGLWRSFIRWCVKLWAPLSYLALTVPNAEGTLESVVRAAQIIVIVSIFLNPLRRGWHDVVAGTMVIRYPPPG